MTGGGDVITCCCCVCGGGDESADGSVGCDAFFCMGGWGGFVSGLGGVMLTELNFDIL